MYNDNTMKPDDLIGMWVPYRGDVVDEELAVLIDTNVDIREMMKELKESDHVTTYGFTIADGGPYDLLAFGQDHYRVVHRSEYAKRPGIEI